MWYLLNEYHLCIHFELEFYTYIFPCENRYFHKFWFDILKNDAYDGEWIKYPSTEHLKFATKITSATLSMVGQYQGKQQGSGVGGQPLCQPPDPTIG